MVFVANHQASEFLHPCKQALDLPAPTIVAKLSSILSLRPFSVLFMRCYQLNLALFKQLGDKSITVICLIANKFLRRILGKATIDGCFNQFHFMGGSAFNVSGDRKTNSVSEGHDHGAFAPLCLADSKTHFFAGTKVQSVKASVMSILPRSARSCASSIAMRRKTPYRTDCWKRLWHVWYGVYLAGRSFQGAPVRKIHNIPSGLLWDCDPCDLVGPLWAL